MYVELHCKTNFSFLVGASHADELVDRAVELGYGGLAVTDQNSLGGVVRAHVAAKARGLPLIVGAEMTPHDAWPAVLWAPDRAAYGQLARLITLGRRQAPKGQCWLSQAELLDHSAGLLAGIVPPSDQTADLLADPAALAACQRYRAAWGERAYLLAELHHGPRDDFRLAQLNALSRQTRLPLVAAGDVHYHVAARQPLSDVLTAIRQGTTVAQAGSFRFVNAQRHLRSLASLQRIYADHLPWMQRTAEIAARCHFSLDQLRYEYPEELAPHGMTPLQYLRQLTWEGASQRYPAGIPPKVRDLLGHELGLIAELNYEAYFLTVWDLVRFARRRGILCQGAGPPPTRRSAIAWELRPSIRIRRICYSSDLSAANETRRRISMSILNMNDAKKFCSTCTPNTGVSELVWRRK